MIPTVISITLAIYSYLWLVLILHLIDMHKVIAFVRQQVRSFQYSLLLVAAEERDLCFSLLPGAPKPQVETAHGCELA